MSISRRESGQEGRLRPLPDKKKGAGPDASRNGGRAGARRDGQKENSNPAYKDRGLEGPYT